MKVGDILRYTRFQGVNLPEPVWAQVTSVPYNGVGEAAPVFQRLRDVWPGETFRVVAVPSTSGAIREIFPADQAPDDYYAALARHALLGEGG